MPFGLNYLESGPQDVAAINRLGSTFSDAIVGMQQQRLAQQRFMLQQALEQQRLDLERKKLEDFMQTSVLERNSMAADADYKRAMMRRTEGLTTDLAEQGRAGSIYGKAQGMLQQNRNNPFMLDILNAIKAQQAGKIASYDPGHIAEQTSMLDAMRQDPRMAGLIATGTRMTENLAPGHTRVPTLPGSGIQQVTAPEAPQSPTDQRKDYWQFLSKVLGDTMDFGKPKGTLGTNAAAAAGEEIQRYRQQQQPIGTNQPAATNQTPSVSEGERNRRLLLEDQRAHPGMHRVRDVATGIEYYVSEGEYHSLKDEKDISGNNRFEVIY